MRSGVLWVCQMIQEVPLWTIWMLLLWPSDGLRRDHLHISNTTIEKMDNYIAIRQVMQTSHLKGLCIDQVIKLCLKLWDMTGAKSNHLLQALFTQALRWPTLINTQKTQSLGLISQHFICARDKVGQDPLPSTSDTAAYIHWRCHMNTSNSLASLSDLTSGLPNYMASWLDEEPMWW